ncbi:MAG: hypothetical protein J6W15_02175 [Clostridia bacterium]|nr:hypothetical protein [Clostridia bacterium]
MGKKILKLFSRKDIKALLLLLPLVMFFGIYTVHFLYTDGNDVIQNSDYEVIFSVFAYCYAVYSFVVTRKSILPFALLAFFSAASYALYGSFSDNYISDAYVQKSFFQDISFKLMIALFLSLSINTVFTLLKRLYEAVEDYAQDQAGQKKKNRKKIFGNIDPAAFEILCGYILLHCIFFAADTHFEIISSGYLTVSHFVLLLISPWIASLFGVAATLITKRFFVPQLAFTVLIAVSHIEALMNPGAFALVLIQLCCSYVFALLTRIVISFVNLLKTENRHSLTKGKIILHAVSFSFVSLVPIGAIVFVLFTIITA